MNDIMCDIETLGTSVNSVITQVGLLYFDRHTGELGEGLCVNIQIQDCLNWGLSVDGGSIKFWLEQPCRSFLKEPQPLTKALSKIREFYEDNSLVWSHATFDFPILENSYKTIKQKFAFPYKKLRDIRTLVDLSGLPYKKESEGDPKTHNALDDCKYQVEYCVKCFNALKRE